MSSIFDFLGGVFFVFSREQRDETFGERFKQENHHDDETITVQQSHPSAYRQEEAHKGDMHIKHTWRPIFKTQELGALQ